MKAALLLFFSAMILWADAHIFVYHRFNDNRYPSTNTTNENLRADFEYFKNNGYKVVPLSLLVNSLKEKKNIPDNWIVLTIDDNYKSFYDNGLAIFKEYNYPFSLFVFVEGTHKKYPDYTTWKELKEISKYGSIEFHSYAHKHMQKMSKDEIIKDFNKGMKLIEENLEIKPKYFSYPYGEYTKRVKDIVVNYGFEAVINQNMGAVGKNSDIYDLDRTALVGKSNLKHYLKYKYLDAKWFSPTTYPKDKILKDIKVSTQEIKAKNAKVYVSGNGWSNIKIKNGKIEESLNKKLKFSRSRVIVDINNKISSKIIIKDSYATK